MVSKISLTLGAIALGSLFATSVSADRQLQLQIRASTNESDAVGTNLYNCHDNCGEALLEEEVDGYCNSTIFSTDYAACLQCSGPDNEDIWQYYGPYLTAGAEVCGSSTMPADGTQADVSTALVAQSAASTATTTGTSTTISTGGSTSASAGSTGSSTAAESTASTSTSGASKIGSTNSLVLVFASALLATGLLE